MEYKNFKSNEELVKFIRNNNIEIISTHTAPGQIEMTNWKHSQNHHVLEVTLLYRVIEVPEKVMI